MISIFIRTIIIYVVLVGMLKIMGKRQIGELEVNELVSTLLISEIASIPISEPNIPLINAILPILFICLSEVFISALKNKWSKLKTIVEGEPSYIIYKGRLNQEILSKNRISINELLTEIRQQGIGDISDVEYGILEPSGKLSLIKANENDMAHTVIVDGNIDYSTLKQIGLNEKWINKQLKSEGYHRRDVFLFSVTDSGKINIITKDKK